MWIQLVSENPNMEMSSVEDPDSGSGAFFTAWIRKRGPVQDKFFGIPDPIDIF